MLNTFRGLRRASRNTEVSGDSEELYLSQSESPTLLGNTTGSGDISSSEYAHKCRKLMNLLRDLRKLGGDLFFDMPRLTVIGAQSTGKSSLVESVSGIYVPRDSGTCTRCPMECNLSTSSSSWKCTIYLRLSFSATGEKLPTSEQQQFGQVLYESDKASVELWLRRAQAAILNPHLDSTTFYKKTARELKERDANTLPFSENTIVVNVDGPDLTDLSFIDLPGLMQNQEPEVIDLVRNLVVNHIQRENTLILITIPMSDDMENQQAVRLAREADPAGERTIGVLTKPDTLGPGAQTQRLKWRELLEGHSKDHSLKHGYYCVRLPDDEQRIRNISRAELQQIASDFFNNTEPWRGVHDRKRFGVPNFIKDVSELLVKRIEKFLPELRKKVNDLLESCDQEIARLPGVIVESPSAEVFLRVTRFCDAVRDAVLGKKHRGFVQANRERYDQFKEQIFATRPNFWPSHAQWESNNLDGEHTGPVIDLDSVQRVIAESIGWEFQGHVPFEATSTLILAFTNLWGIPSFALFDEIYASTSEYFITSLTSDHFWQYKRLQDHVREITRAVVEECREETLRFLQKVLALEKIPLFTQNSDIADRETFWLTRYRRCHHYHYEFWNPRRAVDILPVKMEPPTTPENLNALRVMATVRAYFEVAHKRIFDYVPLAIEHEFHQALAVLVQEKLFNSLLQDSNDISERMRDLLTEDPHVAKQREMLLEKRQRLTEIKRTLDTFRV